MDTTLSSKVCPLLCSKRVLLNSRLRWRAGARSHRKDKKGTQPAVSVGSASPAGRTSGGERPPAHGPAGAPVGSVGCRVHNVPRPSLRASATAAEAEDGRSSPLSRQRRPHCGDVPGRALSLSTCAARRPSGRQAEPSPCRTAFPQKVHCVPVFSLGDRAAQAG